jgi:3-dehydroquinate dehydratase-1
LKSVSPRIGKVVLAPHRAIVIAPVTDRTSLAAIAKARKQGVELAEARVDLFARRGLDEVRRYVTALRREMPVLVTLRSAREGGEWPVDEDDARLVAYRALLGVADAVDVEVGAPIRAEVVAAARAAKRVVVLSHHDFERTPPDAALERVVTRARRAGADIVKIAARVAGDADVARLAGVLTRHPDVPLVVIGMGDHGKKTRVFFPALGSRFTFAALGRGTAPGQLDVKTMRAELAKYYPPVAPQSVTPRRR